MQRLALYARVSTDDQKADLQVDALQKYAQARGFEIAGEYVDHESGAKTSRPALNEMLADARRRRFDAVVVWKIDRLGRSVSHLLTVLTELQSLGIAFVSLQEAIDTATPAGRMVFTFLGAVAEFERAIIAERVKAGMQAAKKRGRHCGRPKAKVDLSLARKLRSEGKPLRDVAAIVGVSPASVLRLLKSQTGVVAT
jgi:DNA invertase Pin-like site-specific DNA recombinase